jgi:putative membrane protein
MRTARVLLAGLAAAQVAYGRLPAPRPPRETRALVGLMLAASAAEAAETRGALPLAAAGGAGFAAELAGVATGRPFGRYEYTDRLGPRVAGVPVLAAAAWAMMARPAWVVAGHLTRATPAESRRRAARIAAPAGSRRRAARIAAAAGALTAWDLFLDPRMAREGYWTWPGGGRYEGVPASNFAGWFTTGLGVFALWSALEDAEPDARDDGALALYAWTWLGEAFANAVLWRRPRVAAGGGVAMGAFALPALWCRWHG